METIAFLRAENERREAALVEHRRLLEQGSSSESSERNGFLETIAFLRAENERREAALVEHRQLLGASHAEVWRLGGLIQAVHASTSWRVSWPLRASKRFLHAGTKALAGLGYRVLRWSARMLRPSLRWIAQLRWLRRIVVAVIGEDSALIVRARSFLFGASQAIDLPGGMSEPDGPDVLESLDRQGARIYQHIHAVQTNKGKGKRH
ncbi:hypothetical protein [Pseudoxanthomonas sp.]|uniref:hypothetical protein n=1 Tax=Pseudoxanthomonas sp. TaxID=1871049 RepID=UPI00262E8FD1|nr:hypothetical protein [Pseudoxanthomonas sp.]WDS35636.1 MAG: hypothetical protein O8I58_15065 [Pseudoxanthomonas sp.]